MPLCATRFRTFSGATARAHRSRSGIGARSRGGSAGYKDAADALVGALAERKAPLDSVVYPLVFLYRQGLELELKLILPLARRLAGKEASVDIGHKLMPLWSELADTSNSLILARTTKICRPLMNGGSGLMGRLIVELMSPSCCGVFAINARTCTEDDFNAEQTKTGGMPYGTCLSR